METMEAHVKKSFNTMFYAITLMTLVAVSVFAFTLFHATVSSASLWSKSDMSETASGVTVPPAAGPTSAHPARLIIPSIGVDASVENVGITSRGSIGTPASFADVGWYVYGATPGKTGAAIIDGHVDNGLALAGVFKHLSDIKKGATITVVTEGGIAKHFEVKSIVWYDYQNTPSSILFPKTKSPTLILVTCGGTWVPNDRTYNKRLVVTAVES